MGQVLFNGHTLRAANTLHLLWTRYVGFVLCAVWPRTNVNIWKLQLLITRMMMITRFALVVFYNARTFHAGLVSCGILMSFNLGYSYANSTWKAAASRVLKHFINLCCDELSLQLETRSPQISASLPSNPPLWGWTSPSWPVRLCSSTLRIGFLVVVSCKSSNMKCFLLCLIDRQISFSNLTVHFVQILWLCSLQHGYGMGNVILMFKWSLVNIIT